MLADLKSIYDEKNVLSYKLTEIADNFTPSSQNETPTNQSISLSQILNNLNLTPVDESPK
jgi:hypothetical protein